MCLISNAGSRRVCDRVRVCVAFAFAFGLPSLDPFSASAKPRDPITNGLRHRNSLILPLVTLEKNAIITRSARPDVEISFRRATRCVVRYESRLRFCVAEEGRFFDPFSIDATRPAMHLAYSRSL